MMQTSPNTSKSGEWRVEGRENPELLKWYDRPWAAFMFFTRLPLWRLHQPPEDAYRSVVEWWPLVGWLTAAVMAGTLYGCSLIFPYSVAVLLAIVVRMMLTGALHEDGLADFFDGFGGGTNRERILAIMKDSHIGTYGVLALIIYVGLLFVTLLALPPRTAAFTILAADPYAKMLSAQIVQMLPYARNEETAKSGVVYRRYGFWSGLSLAVQGLLPLTLLYLLTSSLHHSITSSLPHSITSSLPHSSLLTSHFSLLYVPAILVYFLYIYIRKRLGGYTGDCCGALFLLTELTFYLVASCLLN